MMRANLLSSLGGMALLLTAFTSGPVQAAPVDIHFDDLAQGVVVINQYPQATFSSTAGEVILTTAQNLGSSLPNFICTAPVGSSIDCINEVIVDFTSSVSDLQFVATGANDTGIIGQIDVFVNSVLSSTVDIIGAGDPFVPVLIDLTAFSNVTSIRIFDVTDAAGLGYDDFKFDQGPTAVPEPGALALLATGLTGLALIRRHRAR